MRTVVVLLAVGSVWGQAQDTRPAFEAASIKLNTSGGNGSSTHGSRGQVVMSNLTLKRLIERAYNAKPFQVTGPNWLESIRFDISAKYPPDTREEDRPVMLRTLLEERFGLVVHRESKEVPGYALVIAKGGFKLKPVDGEGSDINQNSGRVNTVEAKRASMARLADIMAQSLGEFVVDQTGLDGAYAFTLRWTNDDQKPDGNDPDLAPSLFTVLPETLGLRLQRQRVPVELIVVDHAEQAPSEN